MCRLHGKFSQGSLVQAHEACIFGLLLNDETMHDLLLLKVFK